MSASVRNGTLAALLSELSLRDLAWIYHDWRLWAREDQLPPDTGLASAPWRVWVILGGRGAGKTRAGAEWVRATALGLWEEGPIRPRRIALLGETHADVRRVMIEGQSGLLAVHPNDERPQYQSFHGCLIWPNGSIAHVFSAESPDQLRGPQFEAAWCEELAKWREPERAWDMLQFALRLGVHPRICVTTTPRPIPLLKAVLADQATVVTRATTHANSANLAPGFIAEMERRYAGSVLGRQELLGEIVEDDGAALWRRDWIEQHRVEVAPDLMRLVVAVDPPVTSTARSDACGIVVAGLGADNRGYVLADRSLSGRAPNEWAREVVGAYREFNADRIVAEVNQGGDLVVEVLRQIDDRVPVRTVRASRGKWLRAEPVASLYAEGRVAHVGRFAELEREMLAFATDGRASGRSPDRLDALVWALTDLILHQDTRPALRWL